MTQVATADRPSTPSGISNGSQWPSTTVAYIAATATTVARATFLFHL